MEYVAGKASTRPTFPALFRCGDDMADDRQRIDVFELLSHPRLPGGSPKLFRLYVPAGRRVHGALVESHAPIRWIVRLPEYGSPGVLRAQVALEDARRATRPGIERPQ